MASYLDPNEAPGYVSGDPDWAYHQAEEDDRRDLMLMRANWSSGYKRDDFGDVDDEFANFLDRGAAEAQRAMYAREAAERARAAQRRREREEREQEGGSRGTVRGGITQRENRRRARQQHAQALATVDQMYRDHELDSLEQLPGFTSTRDSEQDLRRHNRQAGAVLQPLSTTFSRRAKEGGYDNEPTENHSYRVNVDENRPLVDIEADAAREREQQRQTFMARELERQLQAADDAPTFRGSGFGPAPLEDLVYR
eukprot:COSAG01_NODE_3594_length_5897_cov_18.786651_5_plen_254_part_00